MLWLLNSKGTVIKSVFTRWPRSKTSQFWRIHDLSWKDLVSTNFYAAVVICTLVKQNALWTLDSRSTVVTTTLFKRSLALLITQTPVQQWHKFNDVEEWPSNLWQQQWLYVWIIYKLNVRDIRQWKLLTLTHWKRALMPNQASFHCVCYILAERNIYGIHWR